jgi:hypothetical protein
VTVHAFGGWNWPCDIYKANVVLLCCQAADIGARLHEAIATPDEQFLVTALLSEHYGFGDIDADDPPGARCCCLRRNGFTVTAIWLPPTASAAVIAHEAFHAAAYMLHRAGLTLSDASEEAFAYLLEWLVRGITSCLDGSTPPAPARMEVQA